MRGPDLRDDLHFFSLVLSPRDELALRWRQQGPSRLARPQPLG
jgi:hypothetical protein